MNTFRRLAVYCASSNEIDPIYREAATTLGHALADAGIRTLVFGGGSVGLMGAVADAVIARGGEVIGVIPRSSRTSSWVTRGAPSCTWWTPCTRESR